MDKTYWVDTHCHLDFDVFAPELDAVVNRALAQNVQRQITVSTYISHYKRLQHIAEKYDSVFFTVGTHPCNAHLPEEQCFNLEKLAALCNHPKLVALGEVGLDYHYSKESMKQQKTSFLLHIEAARYTQLPLVIHARDADNDMRDILCSEIKKGAFSFVLHCYSSGIELAKTGLDLGGYISFSGIVTFKNAPLIREIAQFVPQDRILIETDAPYLAPVPYRGRTNEPSFVIKTAEFLADFLNIKKEDFARKTTKNAYSLFQKMF